MDISTPYTGTIEALQQVPVETRLFDWTKDYNTAILMDAGWRRCHEDERKRSRDLFREGVTFGEAGQRQVMEDFVDALRVSFKSREALGVLEQIFEVEEEIETSPEQDLMDYFFWVEGIVDKVLFPESQVTFDDETLFNNEAIDGFAEAMRIKLEIKRLEDFGGWKEDWFTIEKVWDRIREHIEKGDPVDIGNLAMFVWWKEKQEVDCLDCKGTGKADSPDTEHPEPRTCDECTGTGKVPAGGQDGV